MQLVNDEQLSMSLFQPILIKQINALLYLQILKEAGEKNKQNTNRKLFEN